MDSHPIVVTGAASGIGAALAGQLMAGGRDVIGVDRAESSGIIGCDLANPEQIARLADRLPSRIGGLANVAGVPGTAPSKTVLLVNSLAPRLLVRTLAGRLEPGSAVVNVASVAAHRNTQPDAAIVELLRASTDTDIDDWLAKHPIDGAAAYDTSKRALVDWTPLAADALRPSGVRCLSLSPGPVQTPILDDFAATMGQDSIDRSAAAVGRHGTPDEIAAVVAFALSERAGWLNGIDILVEGGLMATRAAAVSPLTEGIL